MILIWRGWGLLALVVVIPMLASCGGLGTVQPPWMFLSALTISLLSGGAVCVYYGNRWNQQEVEHSLYFVPLQTWGWLYLGLAELLALLAIGGALVRGLEEPGRPGQAISGGIGFVAVTGIGLLLVRSGRSQAGPLNPVSQEDVDR